MRLQMLLLLLLLLMMFVVGPRVKGAERVGVPLVDARRPRVTSLRRRLASCLDSDDGVPRSQLQRLIPGRSGDDRRSTSLRPTCVTVVVVVDVVVAAATGVWLPEIQPDGRSFYLSQLAA